MAGDGKSASWSVIGLEDAWRGATEIRGASHRLVAMEAKDGESGTRRTFAHRGVEQSADEFEAAFRCGTEPARGANAPEALGQHMLQEAMEEFFAGERERSFGASALFPIAEGDAPIVLLQQAGGRNRAFAHIAREILESGLSPPGELAMHDPRLPPNARRYLRVKHRIFGEQTLAQPVAEAGAEPLHG